MIDKLLALIERTAGRIQNWAWDKRFKYRNPNKWVEEYEYNEWKKKQN